MIESRTNIAKAITKSSNARFIVKALVYLSVTVSLNLPLVIESRTNIAKAITKSSNARFIVKAFVYVSVTVSLNLPLVIESRTNIAKAITNDLTNDLALLRLAEAGTLAGGRLFKRISVSLLERKMAYERNVSAFVVLVVLIGMAGEGLSRETRMECEDLPFTICAFAVDSNGARCVLETSTREYGGKTYHCQTSDLRSSKSEAYIENDSCVMACGVDRMTVGISTDEFLLPGFAELLCSLECQMECTNIVDLFSTIVASAAKGASLGKFCNDLLASQGHRRHMRANTFSTSALTLPNGLSPTSSIASGPSSFAEEPASSFNGFADAPTSY